MNLVQRDIIDWEPCILEFTFKDAVNSFRNEFEVFVKYWLRERAETKVCSCKCSFAEFKLKPAKRAIVLKSEWMCQVCVQALADAVEKQFPLKKAALGLEGPAKVPKTEFISVPSKEVEFEDGTRVAVAAFTIARRPVSVGEFEAFVQSTGYVTDTEREDPDDQTFRAHCGLSGLKGAARLQVPAQFVTANDAAAYCAYANCRLPTEAEWLAAAVNDPRERDITSSEELQLRLRPLAPDMMEIRHWDITATRIDVPEERVIARQGPSHFVKKGWRQPRAIVFHRRLIRPDEYDISITFRVVK